MTSSPASPLTHAMSSSTKVSVDLVGGGHAVTPRLPQASRGQGLPLLAWHKAGAAPWGMVPAQGMPSAMAGPCGGAGCAPVRAVCWGQLSACLHCSGGLQDRSLSLLTLCFFHLPPRPGKYHFCRGSFYWRMTPHYQVDRVGYVKYDILECPQH